jgi:hypothetical protein
MDVKVLPVMSFGWVVLSSHPVERLLIAATFRPILSNNLHKCLPINPTPPLTGIFCLIWFLSQSNLLIIQVTTCNSLVILGWNKGNLSFGCFIILICCWSLFGNIKKTTL